MGTRSMKMYDEARARWLREAGDGTGSSGNSPAGGSVHLHHRRHSLRCVAYLWAVGYGILISFLPACILRLSTISTYCFYNHNHERERAPCVWRGNGGGGRRGGEGARDKWRLLKAGLLPACSHSTPRAPRVSAPWPLSTRCPNALSSAQVDRGA